MKNATLLLLVLLFAGCSHTREMLQTDLYDVTLIRAQWTEGRTGFDPQLPGYHVAGDIARIELRPHPGRLPDRLVIAITVPGERPMLEYLGVSSADVVIDSALFNGLAYDLVKGGDGKEIARLKRGECLRYEIVGREIRVTLLPKALQMLHGAFTVSWIDWYRK